MDSTTPSFPSHHSLQLLLLPPVPHLPSFRHPLLLCRPPHSPHPLPSPFTLPISAPDAFSHLLIAATAILEASPTPHTLTLSLLSHPSLTRRRGDRIDLAFVLLTALSQSPPLPPLPPSLSPTALSLLPTLPLTPRAFALFLSVYQIDLPPPVKWGYIDRFTADGRGREAAELAMRLDVLEAASDEKHRVLLMGLMRGGKGGSDGVQVDTLHGYIGSLKGRALREKWRDWTINQMAEESGGNNSPPHHTPTPPGLSHPPVPPPCTHSLPAVSCCVVSVTVATRLLLFYHLPLSDFPRVDYLKRKHEVWWICRMGKSDEFADVLVGNDRQLQRKVLHQLSRNRYPGDLDRFKRRIAQWRLEGDEDVRATLSALATSPPPAPVEEVSEDPTPYFSMPLSNIVMVNDAETLTRAHEVLSNVGDGVLGFDCEFIPQALHQLGLTATHTQLLQVACASHTYLFDLQCLSPPTKEEVTQQMVEVLMAVMGSEGVKVGIGFPEDWRKLKKDFPHLACFQVSVNRYSDLTPLLKEEGGGGAQGEADGKKRKDRQKRWKAKSKPSPSAPSPSPSAADATEAKVADSLQAHWTHRLLPHPPLWLSPRWVLMRVVWEREGWGLCRSLQSRGGWRSCVGTSWD